MSFTGDAALPTARTGSRTLGLVWPLIVLAVLVGGAFLLRFWGIRQSLPFVDHPDEPNPIDYVVRMLQTGDPNQHFFQKPSLYIYLLLTTLSTHYAWGTAAGLYPPLDQMAVTTHIATTLPEFFFWGRTLTALLGSLTVAAAYSFAAQVWDRSAGLAAALTVVLLPLHVRFSQYVTTDVTAAWLVLLATTFAVVVARTGRWRAYLVAGAFAGFAASAKYNAGVVALAIIAAHLLFWGRAALTHLPRLVVAGFAAMATFAIGTPYVVLSFGDVRTGLLQQWQNYGGGNGHYQGSWNLAAYGDIFWRHGPGPLLTLVTLGGLLLLWRERRAVVLVWLSFALPSLLLHLSRPTHFIQNMLPLIVLCTLPIGVVVSMFATRVLNVCKLCLRHGGDEKRSFQGGLALPETLPFKEDKSSQASPLQPIVCLTVMALLLLPSASNTWHHIARQVRGDTRLAAITWIDAYILPGVRVAAEIKQLPHPQESRWSRINQDFTPPPDWYRRQGFSYLIAPEAWWKRIEAQHPEVRQEDHTPLAVFNDPASPMLGPQLSIYPTGLAPEHVPVQPSGVVYIGGARLLGFSPAASYLNEESPEQAPEGVYRPGTFAGIRTFWQLEQPFERDYFIFVHVIDSEGRTVAQRDAPPWQGRFPTGSWRPGGIIVDFNDVMLPAGLPPGEYQLRIGMFDPASGTNAPITVDGQPFSGGGIEVGTIMVGG